ncbi:hypothetical protein ACT3OH_19385 [Vreelandella zhanjiangensis]|uniref:hypothetical protein n=1 Tax=Vreelandella zhanjiangensis TaxID=1121960 RepID=UPI00402A6D0A
MNENNQPTEQQAAELEAIEERFGSYGHLVLGAHDPELTDFQRQHCVNVLQIGHAKFGRELAAQYGEAYPLEALAKRIDHDINQVSGNQ